MREGWKRIALSEVFEVDNAKLGDHGLEPTVFSISKYNGVIPANEFFGKRIASDKLDAYKILPNGGWAYSTIHIDEGSIARNKTGGDGVVSPMYTTMRWAASNHDPRYFELLLRSWEMLETYRASAQGSINRRRSLPWRKFASISIEVPPLAEQHRIVDLIGALDEAIEAAVGQSEAIEASSRSIRARIFSELTTTHPRTTADDTFAIVLGRQKSEAQLDGDHVIPYVRAANIGKGKLMLNDIQRMNFTPAEQNKFNLEIGDVLVVEGGSIGQTAVWDGAIEGPVGFDKHVLRLRGVEELSTSRYAFQWARWCYESGQFESTATGITIKALGRARIGAMGVPEVALSEQDEIASVLEEIDGAANEARAYNDSLRNLRTNLLTALLSGEHEIPDSYDKLLVAA